MIYKHVDMKGTTLLLLISYRKKINREANQRDEWRKGRKWMTG